MLVAAAVPDVQRAGQFSGGRRVQQLKAPGTGVKRPGEDRHQARQQVVQARGLGFRMVQPEERLGLGFAYLVVGLIQHQPRDQLQLLPGGAKLPAERPVQQRAEFAENLADLAREADSAGPGGGPDMSTCSRNWSSVRKRLAAAGVIAEQRANLRGIVRAMRAAAARNCRSSRSASGRTERQQQAQMAARAGSEEGIVFHDMHDV